LAIPNTTQVRFTLDNGTALVYDYFFEQWSVYTNISAVDACIFDSNFTYIQSGGSIFTEDQSVFTDNGSFIQLSLTTSWLSFAGVQGFQRVKQLLILGSYKSPHTLQVNVASDFQ